jgi:hypothetical protein
MADLMDAAEAAEAGITSRRAVLRGAAAAGAAGIAAAALAGAAFPAAASASTTKPAGQGRDADYDEPAETGETIVLHLRDAAAGEIDLFRGTTVTRLHDSALARKIVLAAG